MEMMRDSRDRVEVDSSLADLNVFGATNVFKERSTWAHSLRLTSNNVDKSSTSPRRV